jgi:hypothetical protein
MSPDDLYSLEDLFKNLLSEEKPTGGNLRESLKRDG